MKFEDIEKVCGEECRSCQVMFTFCPMSSVDELNSNYCPMRYAVHRIKRIEDAEWLK